MPVEIRRQRRPLTTYCFAHRAATVSKNCIGGQLDSRRTSLEFIPATFPPWGSVMCERDSNDDILRGNELSRRRFGALGSARRWPQCCPRSRRPPKSRNPKWRSRLPTAPAMRTSCIPPKPLPPCWCGRTSTVFAPHSAPWASGWRKPGMPYSRSTLSIVPSRERLPAGRTGSSMRARSVPPRMCPMRRPSWPGWMRRRQLIPAARSAPRDTAWAEPS